MKGRSSEEKKLLDAVCEYGQEHILRFWDDLDDAGKDLLISDLRKIDFNLIGKLKSILRNGEHRVRMVKQPEVIPLPEISVDSRGVTEASGAGESLITDSKVAVFTAAGGQSSRLGLDEPKGCFPVTPIKKKSLFQVHAEKIVYYQKRFGVKIPWLIMVSETNREQTIRFFQANGFFGLDEKLVKFVEQGMLPAFDDVGKLFLREKNRVFLSPNGHGGTFSALADSGALVWLEEFGIEEIFYFQVDNVLVKVLDPVFIGFHALKRSQMSSKCLRKIRPDEKVGVFVLEEGRITVVEYSELHTVKVESGEDPSSLWAGNIAIHIINREFVEKLVKKKLAGALHLPLHIANKVIPYVDSEGKRVNPPKPNGYKIEIFIFDALKEAENSIILETDRREEFSPLKNISGENSPETVLRDQLLVFGRWFERAGIKVPRDDNGIPVYRLEISPLFAVDVNGFCRRISKEMQINGDTYIE